jgi:hypothetical protein
VTVHCEQVVADFISECWTESDFAEIQNNDVVIKTKGIYLNDELEYVCFKSFCRRTFSLSFVKIKDIGFKVTLVVNVSYFVNIEHKTYFKQWK